MKLSKADRALILDKSKGHCWYCGVNLVGVKWQADHFHPIVRYGDGRCAYPQLDTIANMVPSCAPCNNYKLSASIEVFRRNVAEQERLTLQASTGLRMLNRMNRVTFSQDPVKFWFEERGFSVPDIYEILGVSAESAHAVWRKERTEPNVSYTTDAGCMLTLRWINSSIGYLAIATGDNWDQRRMEFQCGSLEHARRLSFDFAKKFADEKSSCLAKNI